MKTFVVALSYVAGFVMGRYSYLFWRNKYLEDKKEELIGYHKQLLDIQKTLESKEKFIRNKWQRMVDDFSKYQAAVNPQDSGKWSDWDDAYLNSWKSAEE